MGKPPQEKMGKEENIITTDWEGLKEIVETMGENVMLAVELEERKA